MSKQKVLKLAEEFLAVLTANALGNLAIHAAEDSKFKNALLKQVTTLSKTPSKKRELASKALKTLDLHCDSFQWRRNRKHVSAETIGVIAEALYLMPCRETRQLLETQIDRMLIRTLADQFEMLGGYKGNVEGWIEKLDSYLDELPPQLHPPCEINVGINRIAGMMIETERRLKELGIRRSRTRSPEKNSKQTSPRRIRQAAEFKDLTPKEQERVRKFAYFFSLKPDLMDASADAILAEFRRTPIGEDQETGNQTTGKMKTNSAKAILRWMLSSKERLKRLTDEHGSSF